MSEEIKKEKWREANGSIKYNGLGDTKSCESCDSDPIRSDRLSDQFSPSIIEWLKLYKDHIRTVGIGPIFENAL